MFFRNFATITAVKITAAIIAFNEEEKIVDAIESVKWADEIIVVDSGSSDNTRSLAEESGAVVHVRPWPGFAAQKQFATDAAANDWVFSLDADERVSPALRDEILSIRDSRVPADGYRIPRLSTYMGREIRHGGWYPDLQLRLFDRRKGRWKNVAVHESFQMGPGAQVSTLAGDILHFSVEGPLHHYQMIGERYAPLAAEQMFKDGRGTSRTNAVASSFAAFLRSYLFKLGFLDGFAGLCIAAFAAQNTFLKHLILLDLLERHREPD